ncbi:MAG: trimethylamine methyltransferase family protein [Candidatus Latescibacterota bacterium]
MLEEEAERIHRASLALLEDPGVALEHPEVLSLVRAHGGHPGVGPAVARLPASLVEECLARCPQQVVLADRRGGSRVLTCLSPSVFWSCPGMYLYRRGQHRPFTSSDMAAAARLLDQLEQVDVVFGMALDDVPAAARDAVGLKIMAHHTTKHLRVLCFSPAGATALAEMQQVVGSEPWFSLGFTAHGPLRWTHLALEVFRRTAGHGLPVTVNGEPMAGVSGPVTLAGSMAVGNAEILAGIVVNQLLEPGRPCIHNLGLAHVLDMRSAVAVTGGPENALYAGAAAALGRRYHLPSASWVSTESLCPDAQAGLEKMLGFHAHTESGVSAVWGVGQLESELTFAPAQAVIDDEMIAYVRRHARGFGTGPDQLAVEVTRRVGPAGSFLADEHTLAHFREEAFLPRLLFRGRRAVADGGGLRDLGQRAEDVADELAGRPTGSHLSEAQSRELERLAERLVAGSR